MFKQEENQALFQFTFEKIWTGTETLQCSRILTIIASSCAGALIQPDLRAHTAAWSKVPGGGFEPRFNPGSNSGAGSEGGEAEYQHQEPGFNPGSAQVQPRFKPGSTQVQPQVQPRFNPGSDPGSTQFEPTFNPGSTQVL